MDDNKKIGIKGFLNYVSQLKKAWNIAVYDPHSRKRVVACNLPEAVKKLKKKSPMKDVVIIDYKTAAQLTETEDEPKEK